MVGINKNENILILREKAHSQRKSSFSEKKLFLREKALSQRKFSFS
jgi:hypothetical protein